MRRLFLRHGVKPGLRQPELFTLTRELDPPRIDGLPKAQGDIHRSGIGPTEEPLIDGPEHQDLICSRSTRFEHCQDAANTFAISTLIRMANKGRATQLLVLGNKLMPFSQVRTCCIWTRP